MAEIGFQVQVSLNAGKKKCRIYYEKAHESLGLIVSA